ncbi:MAG: cholest-4-en-3-one 26-monooxygenase [Acidimicrobiales bacterium]
MTATDTHSFSLDNLDIHSMTKYVDEGYPWAEWDLLREEAPCFWYERDEIAPFWAITRHADVKAVGAASSTFVNSGGRLRLKDLDLDGRYAQARIRKLEMYGWEKDTPEDFIFLDAPEHTEMRMLTARHFTPNKCREMADEMAANAARMTAEFSARLNAGETADLVHDYAVGLPLMTIAAMMGLERDDWEDIHRWTDAMFDLESMRYLEPGEDRRTMRKRLHREYHEYICELIERKRAEPGDDLSTVIVNSTVDGRPLTEQELHGYLKVLIAAGNETTRNALSRGMLAFTENPDQIDRLVDDPDRFVESAVDEVVRWTTPVIQFARTATKDVELHGQTIKAGDHVGLWYGAANRDPRVFDRPYEFDISRSPNDHLGFGHGGHFCLGANLAKWELRAAFKALAHSDVLQRMELASQPEWLTDLHVGAYKVAPVHYRAE